MKVGDVSEMNGHDLEKCWRYTRWQTIPKTMYQNGRESKTNNSACRTIMTWGLGYLV